MHLTLSADTYCATVRPDDPVIVPNEERHKQEQLAQQLQQAVNCVLGCRLELNIHLLNYIIEIMILALLALVFMS